VLSPDGDDRQSDIIAREASIPAPQPAPSRSNSWAKGDFSFARHQRFSLARMVLGVTVHHGAPGHEIYREGTRMASPGWDAGRSSARNEKEQDHGSARRTSGPAEPESATAGP